MIREQDIFKVETLGTQQLSGREDCSGTMGVCDASKVGAKPRGGL